MNDSVTWFLTLLDKPKAVELFERSKSQGVVLYSDSNLTVHAVLWEWVLMRKMKRLQTEGQPQRRVDWLDAMSITKILLDRDGGPLDVGILRQFDNPEKEPPVFQKTIDDVQRLVRHLYSRTAFLVR
jgi:hypothetical protein